MSRAAVIAAPRRIEMQQRAPIDPPSGHARIEVDGCGVCGSDLAAWEGRPWFTYPMTPGAPGHEAWGRIDAPGDTPWERGQRVVGLVQDSYAEHAVARAVDLLAVPAGMPEDLPLEPVACAVNAAERAGFAAGQQVAVVGAGFIGVLLVRLARLAGADVTVASRRDFALRSATAMGARRAVQATGPEHAAGVLEDAPEGFDVVVEATGLQEPLDLASQLVRTRGRLVIAGYHQEQRTIDMQQWNWKGIDVINAHERDPARYLEGMRIGMGLLADGAIDLRPLVTHRFALDELGDAMDAMEQRHDGFLKAVVRP